MKLALIAMLAVLASTAQPKHKPECSAAFDRTYMSSTSINGYPYKCVDGKYVKDQEAIARQLAYAEHKRALYQALRTRVLTPAEFNEAVKYGDSLNGPSGPGMWISSYEQDRVRKEELDDAFITQAKLQAISGCRGRNEH